MVLVLSSLRIPSYVVIEPIRPIGDLPCEVHICLRCARASRMLLIMHAVVVLPLVPVIPTVIRRVSGCPHARGAACAIASLMSLTTICVASGQYVRNVCA